MIRVTVELVPYGIEDQKRVIGEMKIWNDASGDRAHGNYRFSFWRKAKGTGRKCKEHTGFVQGFPRLAKDVFALMRLVLSAEERPIRGECGHDLEYFDGKCHHTHPVTVMDRVTDRKAT
jgi:hypothetical protein